MIKPYGIIGAILIILTQLNFYFKIEPFASWYFPIIWFGYILLIDSIIYRIKGKSLVKNNFKKFIWICIISAFFWYSFELINFSIQNWSYHGSFSAKEGREIFRFLSFATVLPAVLETTELLLTFNFFKKIKQKRKFNAGKKTRTIMILLGIIFFFSPFLLPEFTFPLVWLSFFFILDPINHIRKKPNIIGQLKNKNSKILCALLAAGIITGFFWELWNYWAIHKWTYQIPYVGFLKIFEMPILGYLGYLPFALELYAMYWFVTGFFSKNKQIDKLY